jgi:UDP-N-acetylmuramoyl-L-alanyl-D-glutamate--2,6-diaminopimelate ligase
MESYFAAKSLLFTPEHAALGIVGVDDDYGRRLAAEAGVPVATWSIQDMTADWHVEAARTTGLGSVVTVTAPDGERSMLHVPVPGAFNVANALCAFAMLRAAGINPDDAALGIGAVSVPGRMQVVGHRVLDEGTSPIVGIVDYAHTPDAVIRVLEALASQRRVIAVLGAGGDRDSAKRPLMGAAAARLADVVIVTDDNPRSEDPRAIRSAILQGARPVAVGRGSTVLEEGDRARAISMAVAHAAAGDAVVVLGKGHETGQEVAGVTTDFDDAAVLLTALKTGTAP